MPGIVFIYPFQLFQEPEQLEDNEFIGVHISDLNRLRFSAWLKQPQKLVILHTMSFRHRRDFNMHRLLRAMDNNTLLSKLAKTEEGKEEDIFLKKETLYAYFQEFPQIIHNTEALLERCAIHFGFGDEQVNQNQKTYTGSVHEDRELLRKGRAMGCFYVESPAMRMLLKKLRVDDYLGLVAASSIIRPGVSRSGMMKEYIQRQRDPEKRKNAHPVMHDIMPDTYGVMVYQEDVIKVAHYFAGLSLAEADVLRRGMSGKYRSREEFQKVEEKFYSNCLEKGYSRQFTEEVWRQIASFAGYAFAKGHSASYAVESYQSLFLKAHYPLEYMVGVINNFGGFYSTEMYVHEARMDGASIHAPCINTSDYPTLIKGKDIYLGLMHLGGLETETAMGILEERDTNGTFESLDDFLDRFPETGLEQVDILIRIDAFRFSGQAKRYPFRGRGVYELSGRVCEEFGFYSIEISRQYKINTIEDPRYSDKVRQAPKSLSI